MPRTDDRPRHFDAMQQKRRNSAGLRALCCQTPSNYLIFLGVVWCGESEVRCISEPHKWAKTRRSPKGMAGPFRGLQRSIGPLVGLPSGVAVWARGVVALA